MPKQTRQTISNTQKAALRAQHHLKPYLTNLALKSWFEETYSQSINQSSISRILSSEFTSLDNPTNRFPENRQRVENWPELKRALFGWIRHAESAIPISQEVIREKGKQYWPSLYPDREMPSFSNGWLRGFQSRWNIKHGEAGSLSEDASTEMISIRQALSNFRPQVFITVMRQVFIGD